MINMIYSTLASWDDCFACQAAGALLRRVRSKIVFFDKLLSRQMQGGLQVEQRLQPPVLLLQLLLMLH